jgi:transketolase
MNSIELALAIRKHAIVMTNLGKSSHVGSVLSIADILAVLYSGVLKINPAEPKWEGRDRFILSKGHAGAGVYAALAETGFFSPEVLSNHCQDGSTLSGHISHKLNPGVEYSTGSLGHGLSVSAGIALSLLYKKSKSRVFCLMSDGECDEGSIWEAAMFASHHKLKNLTAIIDYNKLQSLDNISATLALEPLRDKWESFGWQVTEISGHNHAEIFSALTEPGLDTNKPILIIANTIKGKGVSFMENSVLWHYRSPQDIDYTNALRELGVTE